VSSKDAGGITTYRYDNRNRLVEKSNPLGALFYGYNANGQVTNISSINASGVTLNYTYDQLNRLSEVQDGHAGRTTYTYDGVGNLQGYTYPNGVNHFYDYNALNRLTNLSVNVGISGIASYAYDRTYRLTNETIAGSSFINPATLEYNYDKVGNRLQLVSTLPEIGSSTAAYDLNDRLLSDTSDNNGNTVVGRVTPNAPMINDRYNFENRLIERNNGQITIVYDGDGNRVKKTVSSATNIVTTGYLVDMVNPTGYDPGAGRNHQRDWQPATGRAEVDKSLWLRS